MGFMVAGGGLGKHPIEGSSKIRSAARFAVPDIFIGAHSRLENIDRCTALGSLFPPPAALPSLTQRATLVGLITWKQEVRLPVPK